MALKQRWLVFLEVETFDLLEQNSRNVYRYIYISSYIYILDLYKFIYIYICTMCLLYIFILYISIHNLLFVGLKN